MGMGMLDLCTTCLSKVIASRVSQPGLTSAFVVSPSFLSSSSGQNFFFSSIFISENHFPCLIHKQTASVFLIEARWSLFYLSVKPLFALSSSQDLPIDWRWKVQILKLASGSLSVVISHCITCLLLKNNSEFSLKLKIIIYFYVISKG